MNIERFKKWYFIVPAAIVAVPIVIALLAVVGGGVVMLLWNWLLPPLFGWPEISLLQGFGLLALTRILFGGLGGGRGSGPGPGPGRRGMTAEQRERFRRRMCARPDDAGSTPTTVE